MKKTCVILFVILLCGILLVPYSAFANSAQRQFEGVSSAGVIIKGEDCPVTVTRENLVFDITSFPVTHNADNTAEYDAKVSAEYTFYNPADYDVNMQLVFPFGKLPSYLYGVDDCADASKYSAYVNGESVDTTIRATYSNHGNFSVASDLHKISDTRIPLTDFSDDTPVYKYTVSSAFVGTTDKTSRVYAKFTKDSQTLFLESLNRYDTEEFSNQRCGLLLYGDSAIIYSVGERLSNDFFAATYFAEEDVRIHNIFASSNYRTKVTQIDGSTKYTEDRLTMQDLIFKYYSDDSGVTRDDYYNAVTCKMNAESFNGGVGWVSVFNVTNQLLLWYQYDVSVPSKQSVVNKVVAPLYPTVNNYYTPSKYYYEYYLSPATCWTSFSDLYITVNTTSFMSEYTLSAFKKTENGYCAYYDTLPQSELLFTLCESENPELDESAFGVVMTVILIIICVILGLMFLAVVTGIVCAIAIPIVLARKKQNSSKAEEFKKQIKNSDSTQNPSKERLDDN